MKTLQKQVDELAVSDLKEFPIWQFTGSDMHGEILVRPVKRLPVKSLVRRVVGTQVRLADGSEVWALLGNIDLKNARLTRHFVTVSIYHKGRRFDMARYHDFDSQKRGPHALSLFLGKRVGEVFPMTYDIRKLCLGQPEVLTGTIEEQPHERLTRTQIIGLAVPPNPNKS